MLRTTATKSQFSMEWDGVAMPDAPTCPDTLKEAGLTSGFLNDMIVRTLYIHGVLRGVDIAKQLCLPFKVIEDSLEFLKHEKCIEVAGGELIGPISYRYSLTEVGRRRAQDAMKQCGYVGPAPVPLEDYVEQCYRQAVTGIHCTPEALKECFAHLVIPDALLNAIGPAVVSGRSVFIYGPPGNGKTAVARSVGEFMNRSGGEIYIPYAFQAESSVITLYDSAVHQLADEDQGDRVDDNEQTIRRLLNTGTVDARWVKIRRPVLVTGGELNLDMLDLRYSSEANFYQAPLHVKANGGIFLIDDFGRQLCSPKELLNRWIVPLEERRDFLTLASGKKFEVPFEQLTVFSTNLDPKALVDDAFLRRIRHKVGIDAPQRDVYEKIFNGVAKKLGMSACPEAVNYLYERYYTKSRSPRASDCRDLLETIQSICRFRRQPVQLNRDLMIEASASFITEF